MTVPSLATGRRTRQIVMAATFAVIIVTAVVARRDGRLPSRFQPAHRALCSARAAVQAGDVEDARRRFVDDAHAQLHELAAAIPANRRDAVAALLEAKGAVEVGFTSGDTTGMADDLDRLATATRTAIDSIGEPRPSPCPENS